MADKQSKLGKQGRRPLKRLLGIAPGFLQDYSPDVERLPVVSQNGDEAYGSSGQET